MGVTPENLPQASSKSGELFEALLRAAKAPSAQRITPRTGTEPVPLSVAQQRLWFLEQLEPGNPSHHVVRAFRFLGPLDLRAFENALEAIARRHQILRTTFTREAGQPVQVIIPVEVLQETQGSLLPLSQVDLRGVAENDRQTQLQQRLVEESQRSFDLAQGPPIRTMLLRLGEEEYVFLLVMHHIISDGWSVGLFFRELTALYQAFLMTTPPSLPELPIQYADYAVWQQGRLQSEALETDLAYWRKQLDGIVGGFALPADYPRSPVKSFRGAYQRLPLSRELSQRLKALSQQEGVTLFMLLLAAFKVLLFHYTGQEDIFVSTTVANRNQIETKELIGYFNNIVLMRTAVSGKLKFRKLLNRVRLVALDAYKHQNLPFQQLAELPDLARIPLSQTMFALRDSTLELPELPGITVSSLDVQKGTANFDLYLLIEERDETLRAILEYKTELFHHSTITRMLDQFQTILEQVVAEPNQELVNLPGPGSVVFPQLPSKQMNDSPDQSCPLPTFKPNRSSFVAPRNKLEFDLLRIWERVLGVSSIGVRDNFFSLGGHSLLAIRLFLEIERTLDKNLPLVALFQAPTIEQLAKLLHQEQMTERVVRSSLVPIQTEGANPPFFCLPGNMGNVFTDLGYLAQALGPDQPFYGLQDGTQNPARIETLAGRYLEAIQTVQPEGPYFLGGICSGGVIAFDIAQQLKAQGQQVALLALVEPSPPSIPGLSTYIEVSTTLFHRFINRFGHHSSEVSQHSLAEQTAYLRLKIKVAANLWAAARYAPQRYLGRIHLFLTRESFDDPAKSRLGWRDLAAAGAEVSVLPGDHNTVTGTYEGVDVASMQFLAKQLKSCIDEALTTTDANR